jgi:hypothetical protein
VGPHNTVPFLFLLSFFYPLASPTKFHPHKHKYYLYLSSASVV